LASHVDVSYVGIELSIEDGLKVTFGNSALFYSIISIVYFGLVYFVVR